VGAEYGFVQCAGHGTAGVRGIGVPSAPRFRLPSVSEELVAEDESILIRKFPDRFAASIGECIANIEEAVTDLVKSEDALSDPRISGKRGPAKSEPNSILLRWAIIASSGWLLLAVRTLEPVSADGRCRWRLRDTVTCPVLDCPSECPIAVLMDSDSVDPAAIRERQQ
jgi:hypothetical protein